MPAQNRPTTKKTAAAPRRDKPVPVAINFDTWSREESVDPFPIVIGGKRYESLDPMDIDFRALNDVLNATPEDMFRLLFPDDAEEILGNTIRVGAIAAFNEAVVLHFGLEDFIAAQS